MFPPVHAGVAYLLYAALRRVVDAGPPGDRATLALVVGALLPDLIDQPLYHLLALPSTRTLAHSLLVAVPASLLVFLAVRRSSLPDSVGAAFAVGYLSHPAADALWPLVFGLYSELGFLLWPLTHSPPYVGRKPIATVDGVVITTLWIELPILAAALFVWYRDGTPGLEPIAARLPTR